jgi:UDP-glucose 4-epimerase
MNMKKSIIIIGGTGFIGVNLANYFFTNGYQVCVTGRNKISIDKLISLEIKVSYIDISDTQSLIENANNYENIVWLVTNLIPSSSINSAKEDFDINIYPLIRFINGCKNSGALKKFIFISSGGTVYGNSLNFQPFKENTKLLPISFYGLSKSISESYINFLAIENTFETIILRPSNVYGLNQNLNKPQGIIGFIFDSVINDKSITIYDNGRTVRDFLYVDDLSNAVRLCIEKNNYKRKLTTFNVGSSIGLSITDLIILISKITCKEINVVNLPARPIDCNYNVLDIDKIRKSLTWQPLVKIEDGISLIWNTLLSKKK